MAMKTKDIGVVDIQPIEQQRFVAHILGVTPLLYNAMSEKARRELLMPRGRLTSADKASKLKHDPIEEYRSSVYRRTGVGPTRLTLPAPCFKQAMMTAALRTPGLTKTQIGQLVWITGYRLDVYGVPMLHMGAVRSADMNRTPDIRTRAILPAWACSLEVSFDARFYTSKSIINLLATAGVICGVGDFRQQKGAGNFGQFQIVDPDDVPEYRALVESAGLAAQDAALAEPEPYDGETADLLDWWRSEMAARGKDKPGLKVAA